MEQQSVKARQGARTRAKLLQMARREFREQGYGGASMERLVERAEITRGALYHHFAGKADMFGAVLDRLAQEIVQAMRQRALRAKEPWEALEQSCLGYIDSAVKPEVSRIYLLDGPAVLGRDAWHKTDQQGAAGEIQRLVQQCFDSAPAAKINVSAVAMATLLMGALKDMALALADEPAHSVARISHERALLELLRALRYRAAHGAL